MNYVIRNINSENNKNIILFFLSFLFLFLLIRNNGLYPMVFADEFTYSKYSRLVPFSASILPNYLYFMVFRITNVCGDGFLGCARIINTTFFILTIAIIFLFSKKICNPFLAVIFSIFISLGQMNTYAAYFMPECMYFFFFWLAALLTLSAEKNTTSVKWAIIGLVWGASSLVKPHTLFLLPAIFLYTLYISDVRHKENSLLAIRKAIILVASAMIFKAFVGYFLAGPSGLSLFGEFYSPYAGAALHKGFEYYNHLLNISLNSLWGHILALTLLYSTPVAILIEFWILSAKNWRTGSCMFSKLAVFSSFIIVSLILVTALFTASISGSEPLNHLHIRYYVFALPLLMALPLAQVYNMKSDKLSFLRITIGVIIITIILYGTVTRLQPYEVHSSTAPEIFSLLDSGNIFYIVSTISLVSVATWCFSRRIGGIIYLCALVPILTCLLFFKMNDALRQSIEPDVYDRAAAFANAYLDKKDRQQVVIVGPESGVGGLFRTLYHLDLPITEYGIQTVQGVADYDLKKLPAGKNWVLMIGNNRLVGDQIQTIPGNGFYLTHVR